MTKKRPRGAHTDAPMIRVGDPYKRLDRLRRARRVGDVLFVIVLVAGLATFVWSLL